MRFFSMRSGSAPKIRAFTRPNTVFATPAGTLLYAHAFYVPGDLTPHIYTFPNKDRPIIAPDLSTPNTVLLVSGDNVVCQHGTSSIWADLRRPWQSRILWMSALHRFSDTGGEFFNKRKKSSAFNINIRASDSTLTV